MPKLTNNQQNIIKQKRDTILHLSNITNFWQGCGEQSKFSVLEAIHSHTSVLESHQAI